MVIKHSKPFSLGLIMTGWWYTYPSEKYYESQLGWFFPIYGKIFKNMFQTTNQMIYKPIVRISNMAWMNINNCNIFWPWSIWECQCQRQNHHNPTCWCLMVNVCYMKLWSSFHQTKRTNKKHHKGLSHTVRQWDDCQTVSTHPKSAPTIPQGLLSEVV